MVYQDYQCEVPPKVVISRERGMEATYRTHVWQWVYVPRVATVIRHDPHGSNGGISYADAGGKLVGRCIYCGATWEESSDGDD